MKHQDCCDNHWKVRPVTCKERFRQGSARHELIQERKPDQDKPGGHEVFRCRLVWFHAAQRIGSSAAAPGASEAQPSSIVDGQTVPRPKVLSRGLSAATPC